MRIVEFYSYTYIIYGYLFSSSPRRSVISESSSIDESGIDFVPDHLSDTTVIRQRPVLHVSDLYRSGYEHLRSLDKMYPMSLVTAAIFYGLPVAQLVFAYQYQLQNSGNEDLCYYNFRCAHPFKVITDFNHIVSNMGYIILGVLFCFIVLSRDWDRRSEMRRIARDSRTTSTSVRLLMSERGIPNHSGVLYALGIALAVEGLMSASYHICPNRSNFQFDTAFMYLIAGLGTLRLYQARHPDTFPQVRKAEEF